MSTVHIRCAGCGAEIAWGPAHPIPFVCPNAGSGDGADHLLIRQVDAQPGESLATRETQATFLRYGHRLSSLHLAREAGLDDAQWEALCVDLDAQIAELDGGGFTLTPLLPLRCRPDEVGTPQIYAKIDAQNVSGSHKARHLMGVMLNLLVKEQIARDRGEAPPPRAKLAIASCGNAALAAAVVARAASWPLDVFVPTDAEAPVLRRLSELKAQVQLCERRPDEVGDPSVLRFREAVTEGALPFCCQGTDCGLTIEGGETLGYELIEQLAERGAPFERLIVQVGGGALASGLIAACQHAVAIGVLPEMPVIHAVQTAGGHPLERAWRRVIVAIRTELERRGDETTSLKGGWEGPETIERSESAAGWIKANLNHPAVATVRHKMRTDRGAFMWPWETPPHSIAHGILDDETYDWRAIVDAMLCTAGFPLVVEDSLIAEATGLANAQSPLAVSHTGASGLAGLLKLRAESHPSQTQTCAVILSGVQYE